MYGRRKTDLLAHASSSYQRSRVMTSSPAELIVLLYEKLLSNLRGGAIAIRANDVEAKAKKVASATDIIFELLGALDRERGGEVSERLAALYAYMFSRVTEGSRNMDADALDEVSEHVESLLSAWRHIASEEKRASPVPDPSIS